MSHAAQSRLREGSPATRERAFTPIVPAGVTACSRVVLAEERERTQNRRVDGADLLTSSAAMREVDEVVLRVRGEDARAWLGGQITNDIRELSDGGAVYALVLNARGKILTDAWVIDRGGELSMLVARAKADAVREHFEKYIVMEDVAIEPADETVIAVQGPRARAIVEAAGLRGFPCDRLGTGGCDVLTSEPERARSALASAGAAEIDDTAWELARLRLGIPKLGADFDDRHYPQEAGLKHTAVSFTKGCYLGQEVVCMLENRGQLTRSLVLLTGAAEEGDELSRDGQVVGAVTSSIEDPRLGARRALGYVKRVAAMPETRLSTTRGTVEITGIAGDRGAGQA